jgi:cytochrome c oxidase subunit II
MKRGLGRLFVAAAGVALAVLAAWPAASGTPPRVQDAPPANQRNFSVVARKYAFDPARIEVDQNDLVKVALTSPDIAHSFTVDAYRIAKRVGGGKAVTFEFRADQPGVFPIYCNLRQDDQCRKMHGELVVHAR